MATKSKTIPVGGILFLVGAVVLLFAVGMNCLINSVNEQADESCTELCDALRHKKIKMTDLGCVCENTETQERQVHTGPLEVVR